MNTEVLRELKRIMKITRKLAKIPKLQVVAVTIVHTGNGDTSVPFSPTLDLLLRIRSVLFKSVTFSILPLILSMLINEKGKQQELSGFCGQRYLLTYQNYCLELDSLIFITTCQKNSSLTHSLLLVDLYI